MRTIKHKNYYIELIRAVLCIAVLLYHLDLLKGGYLAVCSFFVLSSYLATSSQINKGDLDLKKYYSGRLKRVYLPLAVTVFITVGVVSLYPDIVWVSLKPESLSVLLGYNNFWQINANLDYFARHTDSPFMHFWYMAILIQFEIVFPFIFMLLKKAEEKKRDAAIWIISALSLVSVAYFVYASKTTSVMSVYYSTFSRVFSLFFGISAYFIFRKIKLFNAKDRHDIKRNKSILLILIIVLCILFIFADAQSWLFVPAMILTSILSAFAVDAAARINDKNDGPIRRIAAFVSGMSYEIYLVQYPVIYLHQCISGRTERTVSDVIAIIAITLAAAWIFHYGLNDIADTFKKSKDRLKQSICILLALVSVFGFVKFVQAKDHTAEMKLLEEQLANETAEMERLQAEYAEKMQQDNNKWEDILAQLENDEGALNEIVSNLNITFIGDSVMLGSSGKLHAAFPNSYCDSAVSRTSYAAGAILDRLLEQNLLGNPVVFHLGTNGTAPLSVNIAMVEQCGDRDVFMINASNDTITHANSMINSIVKTHPNVHKIDWLSTSSGHNEYFVADGVHLMAEGQKAYVQMIHQAIYDLYYERFNNQKEEILNKHEEEMNSRVAFFGNELLIGLFSKLDTSYAGSSFNTAEKPDFSILKDQIESCRAEGKLPPKLVFVYDNSFKLSKSEMSMLLDLTSESTVYVLNLNNKFLGQNIGSNSNVIELNFAAELKDHPGFLLADRKHLSEEGNAVAANMISDALK